MKQWSPIVGKPGELRVSVNLTALELQAFQVMYRAGQLGFNTPIYVQRTRESGHSEVWAILLQEFHDYRANTNAVVDEWDTQIDALRREIGPSHTQKLILLCNFAEYLEPVAV